MRLISFAVLSLLATSVAFAAARAETTTYIDGNLTGVSANTGGTLVFSDEKAMTLRTGLTSIPISYSNVTKAELGAVKETSHDVPLYKVWALHKRFTKTQTQLLIVDFKNEEGADKTMTLELSQPAASEVFATLQSRSPKLAASNPGARKPGADSWWGDNYWKTTRNSDKWSNKPTGAVAPDNQ